MVGFHRASRRVARTKRPGTGRIWWDPIESCQAARSELHFRAAGSFLRPAAKVVGIEEGQELSYQPFHGRHCANLPNRGVCTQPRHRKLWSARSTSAKETGSPRGDAARSALWACRTELSTSQKRMAYRTGKNAENLFRSVHRDEWGSSAGIPAFPWIQQSLEAFCRSSSASCCQPSEDRVSRAADSSRGDASRQAEALAFGRCDP